MVIPFYYVDTFTIYYMTEVELNSSDDSKAMAENFWKLNINQGTWHQTVFIFAFFTPHSQKKNTCQFH